MSILIASEMTKKKKRERHNLYCILINCRLICKHHKANWKSSLKVVENIWWSVSCLVFEPFYCRSDVFNTLLPPAETTRSPSLVNSTDSIVTCTQVNKQIINNTSCYIGWTLATQLLKKVHLLHPKHGMIWSYIQQNELQPSV